MPKLFRRLVAFYDSYSEFRQTGRLHEKAKGQSRALGWHEEKVTRRPDDVQRQAHPNEDTDGRYFVFAEVMSKSKK